VRFWKRGDDARLERELRALRASPDEEFVRGLASELRTARRPLRTPSARVALVGALTAAFLVAVASVGGLGYAASAAKQAAKAVKAAVAGGGGNAVAVRGLSAGGDQYRPGFGFGDPNHNHTGPPGLERRGGALAPPLTARRVQAQFNAAFVSTRLTIDEQASLRISVVGPDGKKLLITQRGSRIGDGISGRQTKTLRYTLLVPREIALGVRVPINLVRPGVRYRIVIEATDPDGNASEIEIPFVLPPA
jgi:hypothetical protein